MMNNYVLVFAAYIIFINLTASIFTLIDKRAAINGEWRIPEKRLFILALFGGALCEYLTMLLIRHKTKHLKFTLGLPLIILFHLCIIIFTYLKVAN